MKRSARLARYRLKMAKIPTERIVRAMQLGLMAESINGLLDERTYHKTKQHVRKAREAVGV